MTKEKVSYKIVGVRMPEAMSKELEALAKDQQRSVSNIIRMAVEAHLNKFFGEQK